MEGIIEPDVFISVSKHTEIRIKLHQYLWHYRLKEPLVLGIRPTWYWCDLIQQSVSFETEANTILIEQ